MPDPYMYSKNDNERQGNYSRQWTGPGQAWAKWGLMRRREPPGDKGSPESYTQRILNKIAGKGTLSTFSKSP